MKRIALCLDGSTESENAARFLARMVHDEPYELIVLSILPKPEAPIEVSSAWKRQRSLLNESYEKIEGIFRGANVNIRQLVRVGHAGKKLVSVSKALDVDLIVLGAVGHSMVARMLLGSTSDFVATHAESSVLVVRSNAATDDNRNLNIGLAYEQSGPARAAFEEICEFKWGEQTQFDLLTVLPNEIEFSDDGAAILRMRRESSQAAIDGLRSELHEFAPLNSGYLLESNHAAEAIVRFAETHGTDLLVVGETQQTPASRFLMGSVSRFVLRHAPCSVWITRNRAIKGVDKTNSTKIARPINIPTQDLVSVQDAYQKKLSCSPKK